MVHVVADPLETLIFCRQHGPATGERQIGPQIRPLHPVELVRGGWSGVDWQGYRVWALPPLLPQRRAVTIGLIPRLSLGPDGLLTGEQDRRLNPWNANPPVTLTIPAPERPGTDQLRRLSNPVHTFADGSTLRVLSAESSETVTVISLLPGGPGLALQVGHLGPVSVAPPPDGPADLWKELLQVGRPGRFRLGGDGHRPLEPVQWTARSLGPARSDGAAPDPDQGDSGPASPLLQPAKESSVLGTSPGLSAHKN